MQRLSSINALIVSQKKEWGEILTGFETKNKYVVMDPSGTELYMAFEEEGSMILRVFLKALRPFEIKVLTFDNNPVLKLKRPFRFYFHQLNVFDSRGTLLGSIQRRFSVLRRIYSVSDASGQEMFQLFGPILHPWTFEIRKNGIEYGKITKKWSGLLKEGFTDADNFGVSFPTGWDINVKSLVLGAVFLIDFVHFENKGK
ncbi:MAG: phospholipid scramblase-related protein [Nitrospirota bacterium]|nr:phospholipid scramblase-related protein [Nitrospirota bacterium]